MRPTFVTAYYPIRDCLADKSALLVAQRSHGIWLHTVSTTNVNTSSHPRSSSSVYASVLTQQHFRVSLATKMARIQDDTYPSSVPQLHTAKFSY